ncbi:MAG: hypothetical protein NT163_12985 [Chlorobiales bacterium]|nr:hypothetical protein [Chlorobiales bacterium]
MDPINLQLLVSVATLFTGAVAAKFLDILYQKYINRPQGVGVNIDANPVLPILPTNNISMNIAFKQNTTVLDFDNLYAATVDIENLTDKDYDCFQFGVDFSGGDKVIYAEGTGKDRYQNISSVNNYDISNPIDKIDFVCKPFNKRDKYKVTVFFTLPCGSQSTSKIKILFNSQFKTIGQGTFGH